MKNIEGDALRHARLPGLAYAAYNLRNITWRQLNLEIIRKFQIRED
jgi:hypothetical protein